MARVIVDMHVHPVLVKEVLEREPDHVANVGRVFDLHTSPQPLETLLRGMEAAGVGKAVLLALDCETRWGCKLPSNETVSYVVGLHPDRFIGFASVDPLKGKGAADELEDAVKSLGLRGLKLNPPLQGFDPTGDEARLLFEKASELRIPVIAHSGLSWFKGSVLRYGDPRLWDDVARDFPELTVILAHCGWPWVWDALTLAMKHPHVYVDVANTYTGTPAEHLSYALTEMVPRRVVERFLGDKIVFGSDFPRMEIDKMVQACKGLPLSDAVKDRILGLNALRVLGLSGSR
ncbi:TPA: amidohydrolase [Candidatus Bathyarchaeota archaeon]|nr:amidohydrolase [Candidatus Bathyarchaeota archaeon]